MINFIRKSFDRIFKKSDMYILPMKITNSGIICKLIIDNKNLKEYIIELKNYKCETLYSIILSIILLEDVSTIYYDCWNNMDLMAVISKFSWAKLKKWYDVDHQLEKAITKDNIINIQIS